MTRLKSFWTTVFQVGLFAVVATAGSMECQAATVDENLKTILSVGKDGQGHPAALGAVRELSAGSTATLVPILKAFDNANPLAVNWLRGAFESVADRQLKSTKQLPAKELEAFVQSTERNPEARRLAYEWLLKVDPTARERLIPKMLQDASPEFRRDAVQRLIDQASAAKKDNNAAAATELFQQALIGAVDDDQVKAIVGPLKELGKQVDLPKHFGFLTEWYLVGPFDNTAFKGFDTVYPPENEIDLAAKYPGKLGEVTWEKFSTKDDYGVFNIAKTTSPHKGAVTYATTNFESDKARAVEFRLGTPNAWKLWVNGELAFARDEYHRGTQLDQYRVKAKLRAGKNAILLKICQNEQTEEWAQDWKYQIRVCDSTGAAILPSTATTTSSVDR